MLRNRVLILFLFILSLLIIGIQVNANSAQMVRDEPGNFEMVMEKDDEISVKSELLTFDFQNQSSDYSLGCTVLAEYEMINIGETKTIRMGFPLVTSSSQIDEAVSIKCNNQEIIPTIFVSIITDNNYDFLNIDFQDVLTNCEENFKQIEGNFYVYTINGYSYKDSNDYDNYIIKGNIDDKFKIITSHCVFIDLGNNEYRIVQIDATKSYQIMSYNNELEFPTHISYTKEVVSVEDLLNSFVNYPKEDEEYYDIARYTIKAKFNKFLSSDKVSEQYEVIYEREYSEYEQYLYMLVYDVELNGNSLVNDLSVSYQMIGPFDRNYQPTKYMFTYFTNPAKNWSSFSNLKIKVIPNENNKYLIDSNIQFVLHNDGTYEYVSDSLPETNLQFSMCNSEKPKFDQGCFSFLSVFYHVLLPLGFILICISVVKKKN